MVLMACNFLGKLLCSGIIGLLCPCYLFGKNAEFLGSGTLAGSCLTHFILWGLVNTFCCMLTDGILLGLPGCFVACYACGYHRTLRSKYNLQVCHFHCFSIFAQCIKIWSDLLKIFSPTMVYLFVTVLMDEDVVYHCPHFLLQHEHLLLLISFFIFVLLGGLLFLPFSKYITLNT